MPKKNNFTNPPIFFRPRPAPSSEWRAWLREFLRERCYQAANNPWKPRPEWAAGAYVVLDPLLADEMPESTPYFPGNPHILNGGGQTGDNHVFSQAEQARLRERRALFERGIGELLRRGDPDPKLADGSRPSSPPAWRPNEQIEEIKLDLEQRALLDKLDDQTRRRVIAAGHLMWSIYFARAWDDARLDSRSGSLDLRDANPVTKVDRVRGDDDESRAGGVAALAIGEMQLFYNKDRLTTVGELVEAITGAHVSMKELRRIAAIKLP